MLAIEISFLTGRYHATPWGRHVNEGVPEWPPSPWRFLRSLLSIWYRCAPDISEIEVVSLLSKLTEPPSFYLPPASAGDTQHYMPGHNNSKPLVFDTFVLTLKSSPVQIIWNDVQLSISEAEALARLMDNFTWFGRAESWADAKLISNPKIPNCFPAGESNDGMDWVRVLCARTSDNLLSELNYETSVMRKKGFLDPPGGVWVNYLRRSDSLAPPPVQVRRFSDKCNTIVRYALRGKPLPQITETISIGELARKAAMAIYGRQNDREVSQILSGKMQDGRPMQNHKHAYYLASDEDRDGKLDHLTISAPSGFNKKEIDALAKVTTLNPGDGKPEIGLFYLGSGNNHDIDSELFAYARVWESITPFVLGRHPKYFRSGEPKLREDSRQIDGPEDQVFREWNLRRQQNSELSELEKIEPVLDCKLKGKRLNWLTFRYWRSRGGPIGPGLIYGFRLYFKEPVQGPITLGYGSHFGLGMFFPVKGLDDE